MWFNSVLFYTVFLYWTCGHRCIVAPFSAVAAIATPLLLGDRPMSVGIVDFSMPHYYAQNRDLCLALLLLVSELSCTEISAVLNTRFLLFAATIVFAPMTIFLFLFLNMTSILVLLIGVLDHRAAPLCIDECWACGHRPAVMASHYERRQTQLSHASENTCEVPP